MSTIGRVYVSHVWIPMYVQHYNVALLWNFIMSHALLIFYSQASLLNTTNLLNITCTLVATCRILGESKCTKWHPPPYEANYRFSNNNLLTYPFGWSIKQPHFHDTSHNKDLAPCKHKLTTMWKASWGLSQWETHSNPTLSKITFVDLVEAFLAK